MTSALILIPCRATMHPALVARAYELAGRLPAGNPTLDLSIVFDCRAEPRQPFDCRAWSKVTRIRNKLMDSVGWEKFDHIVWIDADVVEYPADLPARLIETAPTGIAAPMVFVEGSRRFYDWAAFVQHDRSHIEPSTLQLIPGRNLQHDPPHWDAEPEWQVVPMDAVGCCYSVSTDIYRTGVRHEDHPAYTDHFPICHRARELGRRVVVNRGVEVAHADLPKYGEGWH